MGKEGDRARCLGPRAAVVFRFFHPSAAEPEGRGGTAVEVAVVLMVLMVMTDYLANPKDHTSQFQYMSMQHTN